MPGMLFNIIYIMRTWRRRWLKVRAWLKLVGSANVDALSAKSRRIGLKQRRTGSNMQANDDARRPLGQKSAPAEPDVQANVDANSLATQQMTTHWQANHDAPAPLGDLGGRPALTFKHAGDSAAHPLKRNWPTLIAYPVTCYGPADYGPAEVSGIIIDGTGARQPRISMHGQRSLVQSRLRLPGIFVAPGLLELMHPLIKRRLVEPRRTLGIRGF
jgi:hypothetical protein